MGVTLGVVENSDNRTGKGDEMIFVDNDAMHGFPGAVRELRSGGRTAVASSAESTNGSSQK